VIVAEVWVETGTVLTLKVAEVAPPAILTVVGTDAALVLLTSVTTSPPAVAGPVRVIVPTEEDPPTTLVGFRLIEPRAGELTTSVEVCDTERNVPVIATDFWLVTTLVLTVKVVLD